MPTPVSARRALLLSLRTLLRNKDSHAEMPGFGLSENQCDITVMGRPPTASGKWFYGLYGRGSECSARTSYIEQPSIAITISARIGAVGADKVGIGLIDAEEGFDDRLGALRAFLVRNQVAWFRAANSLLTTGTQTFTLPVFNMSESPITEVGPNHWLSPPQGQGLHNTQPASPGLAATLTLSGFRREQYHEQAT